MSDTYAIDIAGVQRQLRLFSIKPGVRIAVLNILGDTELVQAVSVALGEKLRDHPIDVLLTPEAKSIPLAYALSIVMKLPYVVLRKSYKPYMGEALKAETHSITTGSSQTLYLDEKDRDLIAGKRVALIDDVISTGSTLQGMHLVVDRAGGEVVVEAAVLTEGDRAKWTNVVALGHLPVWVDD
jgi:adenine phosphoribosyltransferase